MTSLFKLGALLIPERHFDSKLVDRLHQDTEVFARGLCTDRVSCGDLRLGTDATTELRLYHAECRFGVATAMVPVQEFVLECAQAKAVATSAYHGGVTE